MAGPDRNPKKCECIGWAYAGDDMEFYKRAEARGRLIHHPMCGWFQVLQQEALARANHRRARRRQRALRSRRRPVPSSRAS